MTVSRRIFLRRSSVLGIAALCPLTAQSADTQRKAGASGSLIRSQSELLDRLTSESFAEQINTTFDVMVSALNAQKLRLVKVSKKALSQQAEGFDIIFQALKGEPFKQGTYLVQHAEMGSFPLFLVPIGKPGKRVYYQAVFNRLHQPLRK